jgi:hypothetical protein
LIRDGSVNFLVDANVLSEPTKSQPDAVAVNWLLANETDLAVSAVVLGELQCGILLLPTGRKRTWLSDWFDKTITRLRILDFDRETAKIWANLLSDLRRKGRAMPTTDSLIAATAIQHDLTIATRNVAHYRHCGVRLVNPFEPSRAIANKCPARHPVELDYYRNGGILQAVLRKLLAS